MSIQRFIRSHAIALGVVGILTLTFTSPASAKGSWGNTWAGIYPNSLTDDNVIQGTGSVCQLCHNSSGGGGNYNAYGWEIRQNLNSGFNLTDSILNAENLDSDQDPTGSTNL